VPGLPDDVLARATSALAAEPPHDRTVFLARLRRHWPDLLHGLTLAYGERGRETAERAVDRAVAGFLARPADLRRHVDPDWFQFPRMVGYAAYRMDDLRAPGAVLRDNGISLAVDLVLNHVAAEHEWARRARAGEARYRDYFHVFPDRTGPDAFEATLPEIFPDLAPGSFTWDDELDGWVWTTFHSWQWDLNWHNPDVFGEFADLVCFLADAGAECLRLDAIAFLWKRQGNDCQN
jgi:amylosucrase